MPIYKLVWQLNSSSGLPADRVIWTTHVDAASDLVVGDSLARMISFIQDPPFGVGGNTLAMYLSNDITTFDCLVYLVGAPSGTPPIAFVRGNVPGARLDPQDLPPELALCLSQKSTASAVTAPPSERGRFFIGPFNVVALDPDVSPGNPRDEMVQIIKSAAVIFHDDLMADLITWVVWSPTLVDSFQVESIWVDKEWDHQSSRGNRTQIRVSADL